MSSISTRTDVGATQWTIDDAVDRLRVWGTDRVFQLRAEAFLGSSDECSIRLRDPSERVSRRHAQLVRDGDRWHLCDLQSKNGLEFDGVRRAQLVLEPGMEVGIGGLTLLVESPRLIALRAYLGRILGWTSEEIPTVDLALRAVRAGATRRAPLVLSGDDDLVAVARGIHRRVWGPDAPFILCDPRRRNVGASVRAVENHDSGIDALAAAAGGSLCVLAHRPPDDLDEVRERVRDPSTRVQLVVCTRNAEDAEMLAAAPVVVPTLASRSAEVGRVVDEYGADAVVTLGARQPFTPFDRAWVIEHSSASLADVEKATLRLVALREGGNISRAAAILGMSPTALTEWIGRRRLPQHDR